MSAALKHIPIFDQAKTLSQKPRLGKKLSKPTLVWKNPKLSHGMHKEKSKAKLRVASGGSIYIYVHNNPLLFTDPSGLCSFSSGNNVGYYSGCDRPETNVTTNNLVATVGIIATTAAIFYPPSALVYGPVAGIITGYSVTQAFRNNDVLEGTHQVNTQMISFKSPKTALAISAADYIRTLSDSPSIDELAGTKYNLPPYVPDELRQCPE